MDARSRLWLQLQNILGRLGFIFLAPFYFLMIHLLHYRIRNLRELRRQCAMEFDSHRGPWIICANHLTMIDSFLLSYSLFGFVRHFTHFGQIPWNLPERSNFQSNIFLAVICYLSKCIPVDRGGSRVKMKKTLDQCTYLLRHGHAVMIFPEGGRSRTGRADKDNFSYGVGRFIKDVGECKVMCVYLRGDTQQQYSMIPAWGDRFHVRMEVFKPVPVAVEGLRAQREYAAQVIERLVLMEEKYFAIHRERYCGFGPSAERSKKHGFALSEENSHRY